MPEVHAAVTGFEILLRFLFPVYDAFGLYGRPNKLIADSLDQRGLMFALPRDRRYGYLDILDVSGLIHTKESDKWSERHWRREMKKLTGSRMMNQMDSFSNNSRADSRRRAGTASRNSLPGTRGVRFGDENEKVRSSPGSRSASPGQGDDRSPVPRTDSAPPGGLGSGGHKRSVSEAQGYRTYMSETPSRLSQEASRPGSHDGGPPPPPKHGGMLGAAISRVVGQRPVGPGSLERIQSESEVPTQSVWDGSTGDTADALLLPPAPVGPPPAFAHSPNSRPANEPFASPELRRANSSVDAATLRQMHEATRRDRSPDDRTPDEEWEGEVQERQQNTVASQPFVNRHIGVPADRSQGALNRTPRDPRQRLSTIPGSPYVGENREYFQSPEQTTLPQLDGVMEQPPPPPAHEPPPPGRPAPPVPIHSSTSIHSSKSIARKPVPKLLPQAPSEPRPPLPRSISDPLASPSSPITESWEGGVIDDEALERVLNGPDSQNTLERTKTATTDSTEPDYASTASASTRGNVSIDKPRAGRLKTVGDPEFQPGTHAENASELPNIDFGRTYVLDPAKNPSSRPGTSGRMTPGELAEKRRSRSADRLGDAGMIGNGHRTSSNENRRLSYFGDRNTPSPGRSSPDLHPAAVAWQPSAPIHRSKTSVTAEEWVQQKAALSHQPQYAPPRKGVPDRYNTTHGRSNSAFGMRKLTKSPPVARALSGDWLKEGGHRSPPPPRPSSRGAGINLDSAGRSLSATEQMQVSRATGSPLIDLEQNTNQQQAFDQQPGMIGYVAQRERDKAAVKEGRNSMFLQQAIAERQQQQQQQQMRAEAEAQAQRDYQMQIQAQQQQMQEQMNQMLISYNQQAYRPQRPMQPWPGYQQQQQQQPPPPPQRNFSQPYFPGMEHGPSPDYAQQQGQQSPSAQQVAQQAYGASYFAKGQQRQ